MKIIEEKRKDNVYRQLKWRKKSNNLRKVMIANAQRSKAKQILKLRHPEEYKKILMEVKKEW